MSPNDTISPTVTTTASPATLTTGIEVTTPPTTTTLTSPATAVPTTITTNDTTATTRKVTTTTPAPASSEGLDITLIAAIGGGVVGFIIIVAIIIVCLRRRCGSKKDKDDDDEDDDDDGSQPQPLPKLDAFGRVVVNGASSEDSAQPLPGDQGDVAHMPIVYEDPDLPPTQARIRDSDKNHYGNIPPRNDSSTGSYVVPLGYRPSGSTASESECHQNQAFDWKKDDAQAPGEEAYIPMGSCSPMASLTGKAKAGGGFQTSPSPCTPKKSHGYVNAPSQPSQPAEKSGSDHKDGAEDEHHYGNVDTLDFVHKVTGQSTRPSPKPVLRVPPMPSPKPSPKQYQETSFSSSPAPSPILPHKAMKPPAKAALASAGTGSPKPSPKPRPPRTPTHLPLPCADTDSDSGGENYVNMQDPEEDYINAPPKQGDYVNAPPKKCP